MTGCLIDIISTSYQLHNGVITEIEADNGDSRIQFPLPVSSILGDLRSFPSCERQQIKSAAPSFTACRHKGDLGAITAGWPALEEELNLLSVNQISSTKLSHTRGKREAQTHNTPSQIVEPVCRDGEAAPPPPHIHRGTINRVELQGRHFSTGKTSPSLIITSPETRCPHDATVGTEIRLLQEATQREKPASRSRSVCVPEAAFVHRGF